MDQNNFLFNSEEEIILQAETVLKDEAFQNNSLLGKYKDLTEKYKKLHMRMIDLTKEHTRQISELANIGKAMSAERNPAKVLEMILTQAQRFTHSGGGTLYLLNKDQQDLTFHVMHNDSLKSYMGGTSGKPITLPSVPLYDKDGHPNHANVSAHVALANETVNIPDVYEAKGFNFDGTKKFDALMNYRSMSMLVTPMRNHEEEIIGVLQLINAKNEHTGETIPFKEEVVDLVEALASQAAVMLTQQQLIKDLKIHLFRFM